MCKLTPSDCAVYAVEVRPFLIPIKSRWSVTMDVVRGNVLAQGLRPTFSCGQGVLIYNS